MLTSNWTDCAITDLPTLQSDTPGLQIKAHKLIISQSTEGRRLSWPEHTVGMQLAQHCLQMYQISINPWAFTVSAKTLIQAFISNHLDYCNTALCGITDTLLRKLQLVQNVAARLLTRTGRREHITQVLRQLHWLPVSCRIDFKLAVLMYQISRGLASTYLQDRCRLASEVSSGRRQRSANVPTFVVPSTRTRVALQIFEQFCRKAGDANPLVAEPETDFNVKWPFNVIQGHLFQYHWRATNGLHSTI